MWYKYILALLGIIVITIFQVTFLGSFGAFWSGFNFILALLVMLTFLSDFRRVLFFVIIAGLILDMYSSLPYGIFSLSLFVTSIVCEMVYLNVLTNRSFYSVMSMGLVALVSYVFTFLVLNGIFHLFNLTNFYVGAGYIKIVFYEFINTLVLLSGLFWLVHSLSKNFKPNFIRS